MAQRSGIGRLARMVAAAVAAMALAMAVAPTSAWALSVGDTFTGKITVGGSQVDCVYKVLTDTSTVQVGDGTNPAIATSASGDLAIPDTVSYGGATYTVASLGSRCFQSRTALTGTGLATNSTVTSLGDYCFQGCESLTDTGLAGNTNLTSLGGYCFSSCTSLTDTGLTDNATLTSLPDGCFDGCTKLKSTGLGSATSAVTSLGENCFYGCTSLADTGLAANTALTSLPDDCFFGCTFLASTGLDKNKSVTSLGYRCFGSCTSLTSTGLAGNSTVTSLGYGCFFSCTSLKDTGLAGNSTVTSLGARCFVGCTSLVDAALGSGLTSVPFSPFGGCDALKTVLFAGPFSTTAKGIVLPHGVDCYHLASDSTWTGKKASDVSTNCNALKALSQLSVVGGTSSGAPTNPWRSAVKDQTLWAEGETVSATVKTGYKLSSWSTSDKGGSFADAAARTTTYTFGPSADSGTTTLTGATPISYKIHFMQVGTTSGTMADEDMTYDVARAITKNALARAGYHFLGWNDKTWGTPTVAYADGQVVSNLSATDGDTVTFWPVWAEDDPVAISYASADAAMGSVSTASESVAPATGAAKGSMATAKAGYHFVSWTDASGTVVSTAAIFVPAKVGGVYVAATYTANFAGNAYKLVLDPNDGSTGTSSTQEMTYGVPSAISVTPGSSTAEFLGWNTAADGSGTAYADGATVSDLTTEDGGTVTLYAQWRPYSYTIHFEGNGATSGAMPDVAELVPAKEGLPASAFARDGYTFAGWNTKGDGTGAAYADKASVLTLGASDQDVVTLYAQWTRDAVAASPVTPAAPAAAVAPAAVVPVAATTATPQTGDGSPVGAACGLAVAGLGLVAIARRVREG